jgi:hypothetical protein
LNRDVLTGGVTSFNENEIANLRRYVPIIAERCGAYPKRFAADLGG